MPLIQVRVIKDVFSKDQKRQIINRARKSALKTHFRKLEDALHDKNVVGAEQQFVKTARLLDQIAAKGTIHANTAARQKSRLQRRVNAAKKSVAKATTA